MASKFPKPGEALYCQFVETWKTVRLKDFDSMENPPKKYSEILEELDDFEHEIVKIREGITKCTCGYKSNHHAADCRIQPHYMITLLDTREELLGVESLFLEPVKFDEELFAMILEEYEKNSKKNVNTADKNEVKSQEDSIVPRVGRGKTVISEHSKIGESDVIEAPGKSVEEGVSLKDAAEVLGNTFIKPSIADVNQQGQEDVEKKYSFLLIFRDGRIIIKNAKETEIEKFIFNSREKECVYADSYFRVGEIQFFQKGPEYAAMVAEGDPEHLKIFIENILFLALGYFKEALEKNMPKVSDD